MGISQVLFGTTRTVPQTGESNWGSEVTNIIVDILKFCNGIGNLLNDIAFLHLNPATTALAAGATLTRTRPCHKVSGSGGAVTLSATQAIGNGTKDTELLLLEGTHATNTVTIPDAANTKMNGLITLGQGNTILYIWDVDLDLWVEIARNM